jgi:hypothetical protein
MLHTDDIFPLFAVYSTSQQPAPSPPRALSLLASMIMEAMGKYRLT